MSRPQRCLNNIRACNVNPFTPQVEPASPCPICRTTFYQRDMIKLRVDFDTTQGANSQVMESTTPSTAEKEVKLLQAAFISVIHEGMSQEGLQQLLERSKAFLSAQPREQVRESNITTKCL